MGRKGAWERLHRLRRRSRRLRALPPLAAARRRVRGPALQAATAAARRGSGAHGRGDRDRGGGVRDPLAALPCRGRVCAGVAIRDDRGQGCAGGVRVCRSGGPVLAGARGRPTSIHLRPAASRRCTSARPIHGGMRPSSKSSEAYARHARKLADDALWQVATAIEVVEAGGAARQVSPGAALGYACTQDGRRHGASRGARIAADDAWYATVLQTEGRPRMPCGASAGRQGGGGCRRRGRARRRVLRAGLGVRDGRQGDAEPMYQRALEAYRRSGNLSARQAS